MNPNVVFIRKICPGQKHLDLFSRPVGLCADNGQRKCLAAENRAVVHASSIGVLVAAGTDGGAVPARCLSPTGIDASARGSRTCIRRRGWADGRPSLFNGNSDVTSFLRGMRAVGRQNAEQSYAG